MLSQTTLAQLPVGQIGFGAMRITGPSSGESSTNLSFGCSGLHRCRRPRPVAPRHPEIDRLLQSPVGKDWVRAVLYPARLA
jgi:hypothetical protein